MKNVDLDKLVPADDLIGDCESDTDSLKSMYADLLQYLQGMRWCSRLCRTWFADGVGTVVAVFLVEYEDCDHEVDHIWMINGDLPTAYLGADTAGSASAALSQYCDLMQEWAKAVLSHDDLDEVFPVDAPPTEANAESLLERVAMLRAEIVPWMKAK